MNKESREYQVRAIAAVKAALPSHPLLVSPVGSGKTFMAAQLVSDLRIPTLWLAHRKELIEQAAVALRELVPSVGLIKAGIEPSPGAWCRWPPSRRSSGATNRRPGWS